MIKQRIAPARVLVYAMVIASVLALVVMAVRHEGHPAADVRLHDDSVWVVNASEGLVGRVNRSIDELDGSVRTQSDKFDVLQSGEVVYVRSESDSTLSRIDPATLELGEKLQIPATTRIRIGGQTLAAVDAEGATRVASLDNPSALGEDNPVAYEAGTDSLLAVGRDGIAHVYSPSTATVASIAPNAQISSFDVPDDIDIDNAQLTAVGDEAILFNSITGELFGPSWQQSMNTPSRGAKIQAPGPAASVVVVASEKALVAVPLGAGEPSVLDDDRSPGAPAIPVVAAGCVHAAWAAKRRTYIRECGGNVDDLSDSLPQSVKKPPVFRVNRDAVVLNDSVGGDVFIADKNVRTVKNWEDVIPPDDDNADRDDDSRRNRDEADRDKGEQNSPPIAQDDTFGVRAGRGTRLAVLANDTDPDGDTLVAEPIGQQPAGAEVRATEGGLALQIDVPAEAEGPFRFRYRVTDGRGGDAEANVDVQVRPESENEAPVARRSEPLTVVRGKSIDINALAGWSDPDGDTVYAVRAETDTPGDTVTLLPNGRLTFSDGGQGESEKVVTVTVSDGRTESTTDITIRIRALEDAEPIANPDHAAVLVGRTISIDPVANDVDPSGGRLRLAKVEHISGAEIEEDTASGIVQFTADKVGTYLVDYLVTNGPGSASGTIRIDATDPADGAQPPVTADDTALLPSGGETLTDVLKNDSDPSGGVLVVKAVEVPEGSGIGVGIVEGRVLRVSDSEGLHEPVTVRYTVSNGRATAVGNLNVVPVKPPARPSPPVATDDEVTVRAGDHVTIPVLENDSHPDGDTISIAPTLVQVPQPDSGDIFISGDTLRFQAAEQPATVYAIYEVVDTLGQATAAQVTIHVVAGDPAANQAPKPRPVTSRALAGSTAKIAIPLDGIDPDGDSVRLDGIVSAPRKGRVEAIDGNVIEYTAADDARGDDRFTYRVIDSQGKAATAQVIVGTAPANRQNQPPAAIADRFWVRPDRAITAGVLDNDSDPDGDDITLIADGVYAAEDLAGHIDGDRIEMVAPHDEGNYSLQYTIEDDRGAKAVSAVRVRVDPNAPLRVPVGRDDTVRPEDLQNQDVVQVPILANDEDPDGSIRELKITTDAEDVSVGSDGSLAVPVLDEERVVFYRITDADGLSGGAFVYVPGRVSVPPSLRPGSRLQVQTGETVTISITDYVITRPGTTPRIVDDQSVTALFTDGSPLVVDATTLSYTSAPTYFGESSISFEVTDGTGPDDPSAERAVLTIPITVVSNKNQPPSLPGATIEIAPGETEKLDLSRLASDPDPSDRNSLSFTMADFDMTSVSAHINGSTLEVEADDDAKEGSTGTIQVEVRDGSGNVTASAVEVSVSASNRPLAVANDDVISDGEAGKTVSIDVLANDENPFDDPLQLLSVDVVSGDGDAVVNGDVVDVTPASGFVGEFLAEYRIVDATESEKREVTGRIRVTVRAAPDAPSAPSVTEVRNGTVVLTWNAPANNGAPITTYTVRSNNGVNQNCASTTCTLTGLTNGQDYVFTVTATNDIGESEPSAPSGKATPDAKPDTPQPPTLVPGDTQLEVSWIAPHNEGSPIKSYTLELSPAGPSGAQITGLTGTSTTLTGLTNGVSYRVRIQALNNAPDPSEFSGYSVAAAPAGKPLTPAAPTAERSSSAVNGGVIDVSWTPPDNNGAEIQRYDVHVFRGSSRVDSRTGLPASTTSLQFTGLDKTASYSFAVVAHNAMGESEEGAKSTPLIAYGKPGSVSGVSVSFGDGTAQVRFSPADDNGSPISSYTVSSPQGASTTCSSSPCTVTGLTNGTNYTFTVTAENAAGSGPQSSATSADSPFGPPSTPSISGNTSGTKARFTWDPNSSSYSNGRPITSMEVTLNGSSVTNSGSIEQDIGYSSTATLKITVCAAEGGCQEATETVRTGSAPPPTTSSAPPVSSAPKQAWMTTSGGSRYNARFQIHLRNFPPNSSVSCYYNWDEAPGGPFTRSYRVDGSGNTDQDTALESSLDAANDAAHVTCGGVQLSLR